MPGSYIQYCMSLEIQLPGTPFMTISEWFPFTKWPGQDNRNSSLGLSKGWPRPLNRGDRFVEVKITIIKGHNIRDFDNWPLNGGWPLIRFRLMQVRLYYDRLWDKSRSFHESDFIVMNKSCWNPADRKNLVRRIMFEVSPNGRARPRLQFSSSHIKFNV